MRIQVKPPSADTTRRYNFGGTLHTIYQEDIFL
jgi:hypothetical protein